MAIVKVIFDTENPLLLDEPELSGEEGTVGNLPTYHGYEGQREVETHTPAPYYISFTEPGDDHPGPYSWNGGPAQPYTGVINRVLQNNDPLQVVPDGFWRFDPDGGYYGPTWHWAIGLGYSGTHPETIEVYHFDSGGSGLRADSEEFQPNGLFYGLVGGPDVASAYVASYIEGYTAAVLPGEGDILIPTEFFAIKAYADGLEITEDIDWDHFTWWFEGNALMEFPSYIDMAHTFASVALGTTEKSTVESDASNPFRTGAPHLLRDWLCIPGVGYWSAYTATDHVHYPGSEGPDFYDQAGNPPEVTYSLFLHFEDSDPSVNDEPAVGTPRRTFQRGS